MKTSLLYSLSFLLSPSKGATEAIFTHEFYVFCILCGILGGIFYLSGLPSLKKFFSVFPALFLVYFIPSILVSLGIISDTEDKLYTFAKNYFLPVALFLYTIGIDFKFIRSLGGKAIGMFLVGTIGVIIGGPIALFLVSSFNADLLEPTGLDATWRGLSTLAGSWIGGGANQAAVLEILQFNKKQYGNFVLTDIFCTNMYMMLLVYLITKNERVNKWLRADHTSLDKMERQLDKEIKTNHFFTTRTLWIVFGVTFFCVGLAHYFGNTVESYINENPESKNPESVWFVMKSSFFWMIMAVTLLAVGVGMTSFKKYEHYGTSNFASFFLYFLLATIGMKMDLFKLQDQLSLVFVGILWLFIHFSLMMVIGRLFKVSFFYIAVGSQANIGGIASAPVVASMFHPKFATVGVVLSIVGYIIGTYGGLFCGYLMSLIH